MFACVLAQPSGMKLGSFVSRSMDTMNRRPMADNSVPDELRKAAVLLASLPNDDRSTLLRTLKDEQVHAISAIAANDEPPQEVEQEAISEEDRRYLGEATLAKIRSGVLEFDGEAQEYEIEYEDEDEDVLEYESDVEYEEDEDASEDGA